jgi:hypothetical protein
MKWVFLLDVDGVTRRGVTDVADPDVVAQIKRLLKAADAHGVPLDVIFISGSPCFPGSTEDWCAGNVPLVDVLVPFFESEIRAGRVLVFGQQGADAIVSLPEGGISQFRSGFFTTDEDDAILAALVDCHARDVAAVDAKVGALLRGVSDDCAKSTGAKGVQRFKPYALAVRSLFDPNFRIVANGAATEFHDFRCLQPTTTIATIEGFRCVAGLAHRDHNEFRFVLVSKTDKGTSVQAMFPAGSDVTLVTIGDTAVDFPMHEVGKYAFHVGLPSVFEAHRTPSTEHVTMVLTVDGRASQVDGTVDILRAVCDDFEAKAAINMGSVASALGARVVKHG